MHSRPAALALLLVCLIAVPATAQEENAGQADLDQATELKINAQDLKELNQVIDLLESALDKGLDEGNTDFAEAMLAGSLIQRGSAMANVLLGQPAALATPKANPQFLQIRMMALRDLNRAVDLDPSQSEAYLLIGRLQSVPKPLGDPVAARDMLTRFIETAQEPQPEQLAQAYALRSVTRTDGKDRLADIGKAVELQPEKLEYLVLRAREHQRQEDYEAALADADQAIKLKPD
ncbi:MAG: hypothetical protein KDA37_03245, partial [Planctomycetales bacterium]|nr:hypothetical protein [Planctomycetales bacterium]